MEAFVSDLLTLARVGGVPATYEQVSSSAILEDIEARIRGRLEDKSVAFVVVVTWHKFSLNKRASRMKSR